MLGVPSGLGATSRTGLAVFCDRGGKDDYTHARLPAAHKPRNANTLSPSPGALSSDRYPLACSLQRHTRTTPAPRASPAVRFFCSFFIFFSPILPIPCISCIPA